MRWGITGVIATVAIIIIGVAIAVSNTLRVEIIANANRELTAVSKVTAERTFQTLSAVDVLTRSIQDLAAKPPIESVEAFHDRATTRAFYDSLVGLQKLLPQIDAAAIVGVDGVVLASSRKYPAPRLDMSKAGFFRALQDHPDRGLVIANPVVNPLNGEWMLYLARSLLDANGHFAGIVLAGLKARYFESYFSSIDVGPSYSALLANQDFKLIARWPRIEEAIGKPLPGNTLGAIPASGETYVRAVNGYGGDLRQVAFTHLEIQGTPLFISVGMTRSAVLYQWRNLLVWIILFAGISLVVLAVLTWLVWRAFDIEERWSRALVEREDRLSRQAIDLAAARDEAERASRVRGEFLANMSHELRTPLNAVLGFSEIMERELFGPLGDRRYREFATDIHRSGDHLLNIINDILDLTKIDAGRLELNEQDVDIADLMRGCGRLVADQAQAAGVRLDVLIPEAMVSLRGDSTRLRQILLNLLSNAIKFTPSGNDVALSGAVTGEGFVITVADTGIGMTAEDAELAMQPFRQIDNSLTRKYQGTGLGLPLAKSLVELHGGTMDIDSAAGVGTKVVIRLPRDRLLSPEPLAA